MNGNGSRQVDNNELSAIREILERSGSENSRKREEIEAMLSELRSLKHPSHAPKKSSS